MNQNLSNFFLCGSAGWCLEILWSRTAFSARRSAHHERQNFSSDVSHLRLRSGHRPLCMPEFTRFLFSVRGLLYMFGFYLVEFVSGSILKEFEMCPWDYSGAAFQYRGIIRLDYAPLWFAAGLIFEKILTKAS